MVVEYKLFGRTYCHYLWAEAVDQRKHFEGIQCSAKVVSKIKVAP
jgi:hypothetical protein